MQRKEEKNIERFCLQCGASKMKLWGDLSADEKFMIERLPRSSELAPAERKLYRYCARCFYAEKTTEHKTA